MEKFRRSFQLELIGIPDHIAISWGKPLGYGRLINRSPRTTSTLETQAMQA